MKIGQPSDNPIPVSSNATSAPPKGGQSPAATATATATATAAKNAQSAGVAVTVSTLARSLGADKASEASVIDAKKVASVRSAIEQGTFVVNAEAIADKLLANAQEMLNRTTS